MLPFIMVIGFYCLLSQRRLSDPSANFNSFMYSNFRTKPRDVGKARSESEGLNNFQDQCNEIEAGDVRDGKPYEIRSICLFADFSFYLLVYF